MKVLGRKKVQDDVDDDFKTLDGLVSVKDRTTVRKKHLDITDVLFYTKMTNPDHFLKLQDGTFVELMRIRGRGLRGATINTSRLISDAFAKFNRAFLNDYGWYTMQFPVDTGTQQQNWTELYKQCAAEYAGLKDRKSRRGYELVRQEGLITEEIQVDKNSEKVLHNKEYIMLIPGDTVDKVKDSVEDALSFSKSSMDLLMLEKMTKSRKEMVLFRLNNPNSIVN